MEQAYVRLKELACFRLHVSLASINGRKRRLSERDVCPPYFFRSCDSNDLWVSFLTLGNMNRDASMELVMEAQQDGTPWTSTNHSDDDPNVLLGRGFFHKLGQVRRKPGRPRCHH